MVVREDRNFRVDSEPDSKEIRTVFPKVHELAIYWSAQKRSWFVSCYCTEKEADGIKELYSIVKQPKVVDDEEFYYDMYDGEWFNR